MRCTEALCDAGAELCCHECDRYDTCEDEWKCHDKKFYYDCLGNKNTVTRKAYICTKCEGVYVDEPVTECDCEVGQDQQFYIGTLIYEKFEV